MSAIERVRRARALLLGAVASTAVLWGVACGAAVALLLALTDLAAPMPLGVRRLVLPVAVLGAVVAAAVVIWRGRHARTLGRVALFIEERVPALQFALATAVDAAVAPPSHVSSSGMRALEQIVARVDAAGAVRRPVARAIGLAAGGLVIALMGWSSVPANARERVLRPHVGDALLRGGAGRALANRLTPVVVRIAPPAYARQRGVAIDDPTAVNALVGSRIEVRGRGAALGADDRIEALLPATRATVPVAVVGDTWGVTLTMPSTPAVLRLADRGFDRLLTLEPRLDAPPTVVLVAPARDTAFDAPRGTLVITADAADDIGLARAEFELMHTLGSGERFETRRWTLGAVSLAGTATRASTIRASIRLDTMHLGPGDVLHVRAIARDENDVSGPGEGASDTRTIRIADPRDRDTLSIYPAAALPLDTSAISQRMLNMRAESLLVLRPRLKSADYADRSSAIAELQATLRDRLEAIITKPEDGGDAVFVGTPEMLEVLRNASSAMVSAATELRTARVPAALPHMRRALALLEKARGTGRLYLRGILPKDVIDVAKVRLKGTDKAQVTGRDPRSATGDARRALLDRIDRALPLLARDGAAGADSLTMIRVDALTQAPDAAASLGRALDALRRHESATMPLMQARRQLERGVTSEPALSAWQSGSAR